MEPWQLKILLVYDRAESRDWVFDLLSRSDISAFQLDCIQPYQLNTKVNAMTPDVCLVDSALEKSALFALMRGSGIRAPMVVLTGDSARDVLDALHHGAADCVIKSQLTSARLEESICAVIDQTRAVESQAKCKQLYLSLVENSPDVIYTHDLNHNCTSINRAGEETLGYTREELLTMNLKEILAPEYLELYGRIMKRLLECRRSESQTLAMVDKEGNPVWVLITCHLIYQDGAPVGVQCIGRLMNDKFSNSALRLIQRQGDINQLKFP
ncbi:MAG TPA: PAS domain S-box protein [Pyrinomonadaceae bacterium]|jgi:PAS domain S-box-containing protein